MVNVALSIGQLVVALLLVVLNGFFVASEFAFVRIRGTSVEQLAAEDTSFRRASYDLGASKLYTFWKIEYPLIYPAVLGSLLFSFLLSFNEFIRGSFVSGTKFSISTLIYSTVSGGSARPEFFAAS